MTNESQMLADIRHKFVGTGEEHDLLGKLIADYREAYDRGVAAGRAEVADSQKYEADTIKFAHTISSLSHNFYALMNLQSNPEDTYCLREAMKSLKAMGISEEMLQKMLETPTGAIA
jgi:hypothetical protein